MKALRILLAMIFIAIAVYTAVVAAEHGVNLLPVFFGDIREMAWPGQFNFDFLCFLILSGVWVSWRHKNSSAGLALGVAAFFGGAFFLSGYLLVETYRGDGSVEYLFLGGNRAA